MRVLLQRLVTHQPELAPVVRAELHNLDVEAALALDRILYGNSYCLEVNDPTAPGGKRRQRLDPTTVLIRPEKTDEPTSRS
jgi:hypothetical protein